MNRHGKHNPDKVLLGGFVTPEQKALAMIVAEHLKIDVTSLLCDGVNALAVKAGIMENGQVVPECRKQIELRAASLRSKKAARQKKG